MLYAIFQSSESQKGEYFSENLEWVHKWDPTSGQTTSNKSAFYCCQEAGSGLTRMHSTEPLIAVVFSQGAIPVWRKTDCVIGLGSPSSLQAYFGQHLNKRHEEVATGSCSHLKNQQGGWCYPERNLRPELNPQDKSSSSVSVCGQIHISHLQSSTHWDARPVSSVLQV